MTDSAATSHPAELAVAFARVLRGAGVATPISSVLGFAEALCAVGIDRRDAVYWAGRATLVRRPDCIEPYDRAFAAFFDNAALTLGLPESAPDTVTLAVDGNDDHSEDEPQHDADDEVVELRFSVAEVLRHRDFADYDANELAEARRWMARLRVTGSPRRSLRYGPTNRPAARHDLRRTVRAAMRTDGVPVRRHFQRRTTKHRRVVLVLDVSGSMEPYARALLRFVHAAVAGRSRVEAFALGTRLTRLTRELSSHDPDLALDRAAERVLDWSGGTRLGDGLAEFNRLWGVRGLARGADVVILSDGWDRGDPVFLAEQMQRLQRVAHRVIWVNPLKVSPGYAPLARGMAAALPYVDEFVEGHSLAALEALTSILNGTSAERQVPNA